MSDSDSFINEVSEEVRRDRLFGYVRRYGWIAVVLVLVLVGGAAFNEFRKSQAAAAAQSKGDALLAALAEDDLEARAAALAEVQTEGPGVAITSLITATSQIEAGDETAAAATLANLVTQPDVPDVYRDLAALKAAMLDVGDPAMRRQSLETLAQPGATFALLAQEQLALADLADGQTDAAVARLTAILEDAGASRGLQGRVRSLMVALGVELPDTVPALQ